MAFRDFSLESTWQNSSTCVNKAVIKQRDFSDEHEMTGYLILEARFQNRLPPSFLLGEEEQHRMDYKSAQRLSMSHGHRADPFEVTGLVVLTSVKKRKKILSLERTGCDAMRSRKFSRPTLRRSTKSGSRLSADSLCHTNSACKSPSYIQSAHADFKNIFQSHLLM